jgi:hypothetical protein
VESRLGDFAIAGNVDADFRLLGDDIGDTLADVALELGFVNGLAEDLGHHPLKHVERPDQAAYMGRQDTIGAAFHIISYRWPLCWRTVLPASHMKAWLIVVLLPC